MSRIKTPTFVPPAEPKNNILLTTFNSLLPVFAALASILAIRLFLLFAVVGSFVLAQKAMKSEDFHGMWVLIAYCSLTVLPLVWLDYQSKKKG